MLLLRSFLTTFLITFIFGIPVWSQKNRAALDIAINQLEQGLIEKDTVLLNKILHSEVTIGHSNGWVQNKQDVFRDFENSIVAYKKIERIDTAFLASFIGKKQVYVVALR